MSQTEPEEESTGWLLKDSRSVQYDVETYFCNQILEPKVPPVHGRRALHSNFLKFSVLRRSAHDPWNWGLKTYVVGE